AAVVVVVVVGVTRTNVWNRPGWMDGVRHNGYGMAQATRPPSLRMHVDETNKRNGRPAVEINGLQLHIILARFDWVQYLSTGWYV
ncbi:MAG: hypothetical protein JWP29_5552, partial [Rhodoferax sp.]|nr:hypothetical protein [Rhodoferax sp.]